MEKRVLLAVFLSFLVLYGYQALFPAPKPLPARKTQGSATGSSPAPVAALRDRVPCGWFDSAVDRAAGRAGRRSCGNRSERLTPAALVAEAAERSVTIDTASITAVLPTVARRSSAGD